jgi:hypothetical protein
MASNQAGLGFGDDNASYNYQFARYYLVTIPAMTKFSLMPVNCRSLLGIDSNNNNNTRRVKVGVMQNK